MSLASCNPESDPLNPVGLGRRKLSLCIAAVHTTHPLPQPTTVMSCCTALPSTSRPRHTKPARCPKPPHTPHSATLPSSCGGGRRVLRSLLPGVHRAAVPQRGRAHLQGARRPGGLPGPQPGHGTQRIHLLRVQRAAQRTGAPGRQGWPRSSCFGHPAACVCETLGRVGGGDAHHSAALGSSAVPASVLSRTERLVTLNRTSLPAEPAPLAPAAHQTPALGRPCRRSPSWQTRWWQREQRPPA
jgi:hypothetical protein